MEYASELRYRNPPLDSNTLLFAITQSGETADTLAALREMKRKGHPTLAICNVVGSIDRPGGRRRHLSARRARRSAWPRPRPSRRSASRWRCWPCTSAGCGNLSFDAGHADHRAAAGAARPRRPRPWRPTTWSRRIAGQVLPLQRTFLYLGRQYNFPTALEGALKLKEISYIHAEGYPAAEMKHGPIALVDEHTPSVFLIPHGFVYDKVMSNLEEIKARGGPVIAVVCEGDTRVADLADDVIDVPTVDDFLQPIVTIIPLQLLAYHIAVLRGCDVDKPRNLAKSVTVE